MSDFYVGQKVVCTPAGHNYAHQLTEGKEYVVIDVIAPWRSENGFRFPEYVTVIGDFGKPVEELNEEIKAYAEKMDDWQANADNLEELETIETLLSDLVEDVRRDL